MYSTSTQKKNWLFKDVSQIVELRKKANDDFIRKQNVDVSSNKKSTLLRFFVY